MVKIDGKSTSLKAIHNFFSSNGIHKCCGMRMDNMWKLLIFIAFSMYVGQVSELQKRVLCGNLADVAFGAQCTVWIAP